MEKLRIFQKALLVDLEDYKKGLCDKAFVIDSESFVKKIMYILRSEKNGY